MRPYLIRLALPGQPVIRYREHARCPLELAQRVMRRHPHYKSVSVEMLQ